MEEQQKTNQNQSMKELAVKGVATLSVQSVLLQGIWFFTSLVLLNSISVFDYSVLKLVLVAVAFPSALYIAGIDPIILADMGVEREHGRLGALKSLFRAYAIFEIISAFVIWTGFYIFISFFKGSFSPPTQEYLFAASFMIFSRPLQNILIQFFNLYFQFKRITLMKLYDEGLTLLSLLFFVFYLKQGIYAAILIQVISPFIAVLLSLPAFFALYRKHLHRVQREPAGFWARLRAHGKWSIAAAYVSSGSDALHLFFIDRFIGREAVALYSLADSLWGHVTSLFPAKSILSAMIPQRARDEATARQSLIRGSKYAFLGFTAVGLAATIGGYPFLQTFFPKYVAAFPVFLGLLLMIPKTAFSSALGPLLRAYKFQKAGFSAALLSLVLTAVFAYVLYPAFGMKGVIAEVVLTGSILVYVVYRSFIHKYPSFKIRLREIFSWDQYDSDMMMILVKGIWRRAKSFQR